MAKDVPDVIVQVPPEFAAEFMTEELKKAPMKREIRRLKLGDVDLGAWMVVKVATRRHDAGYDIAEATLRAVWP